MERFLTSRAKPQSWSVGKIVGMIFAGLFALSFFMTGASALAVSLTEQIDDPASNIIAGLVMIGFALAIGNLGVVKPLAASSLSRDAFLVAEHLALASEPEVSLSELGLSGGAAQAAKRVRKLIQSGYIKNVIVDAERGRVAVDEAARPQEPPKPAAYQTVCPHCGGVSQLPETGPRVCPYCGMRI